MHDDEAAATFPIPDWDVQRTAERTWSRALDEARDRSDPKVISYRDWMNRDRRRAGVPELSYLPPVEITVLADHADRMGMTAEVWGQIMSFRNHSWRVKPDELVDAWRYVHRVGEYANIWRPSC